MKLFKDPVYDYIICNEDEIRIIDSPWFQRLRHCSQNGLAKLVYPTLLGSRFEHSLGVMHLAEKMLISVLNPVKYQDKSSGSRKTILDEFLDNGIDDINAFYSAEDESEKVNVSNHEDTKEVLIRWVRLAGLCHDLGHFPLSHTLESVFKEIYWDTSFPNISERVCHEVISAEFVRQIASTSGEDLYVDANGKQIITKSDARAIMLLLLLPKNIKIGGKPIGQTVFSTLHKIIVGSYDADRLDYLQRDAHLASASFGLIDIERFLDSLLLEKISFTANNEKDVEYEENRIVIMPTVKGVSAIETILLERYKSKKWVHFHHKVVFFDRMVQEYAQDIFKTLKHDLFSEFRLNRTFSGMPKEDVRQSYASMVIKQLSGEIDDEWIWPLCVFPKEDFIGFRQLDCMKFVRNASSHFIDDIWFFQLCRKHEESRKTLVERRPTSLSIWKTPDMFLRFWDKTSNIISLSDSFWTAIGVTNKKAAKGTNFQMDNNLTQIFRDEEREYVNLFGKEQSDHISEIEAHLTKKLGFKNRNISVKMSYVRWKNLFFDKTVNDYSDHVICPDNGLCPIDSYSGLISSLVGLRGETLFYIYLFGDELEIHKLKKEIDTKEMINKVAEHFANFVIASVQEYCGGSQRKKSFARNALQLKS